MKNPFLVKALINLGMITSLLFAASSSFAMYGTPSQPPGAPPRGLAIQGNVSGTKLTGTVTIEFAPLFCTDINSSDCALYGATFGFAKATLRLKKAGGTLENNNLTDSGKTNIIPFVAGLGAVPINEASKIQQTALDVLTPQILKAFFGVSSGLSIYTKDVSEFSLVPVFAPSNASIGTYAYDPDGNMITSFIIFADVVLAVK